MKVAPSGRVFRHPRRGFTLAEVIISVGIAGLGIGGIVWGYIITAQRAEWSTCSSAAQLMAMRPLEQARAAKWDPLGYPPVDELVSTNFPTLVAALDLPLAGTNVVRATNTVTIHTICEAPPLKSIRVDCAWSVLGRGPFTNTVMTYRAAD